MDEIIANIEPTAQIVSQIKPIYNFKAGDEEWDRIKLQVSLLSIKQVLLYVRTKGTAKQRKEGNLNGTHEQQALWISRIPAVQL